jgi:YhcH/YjgK/YiaL family protein
MIYDKIENLGNYPELKAVKAFCDTHKLKELAIGKYSLENGDYLAVSEYETGKEKDFEAHEKYIDVQYVIEGEEIIVVADKADGELCKDYDEGKDVAFYKAKNGTAYTIDKGHFILLDVDDLHQPCVAVKTPVKVKKYVFKLKK